MADEPALPPDAKIGTDRSQYEPWDCEACHAMFDLAEAWFDPQDGIVCPTCKSKAVGPIGAVQ